MALEEVAINAMLDELGTLVTHLGLHSDFPATSGNEIAGGTPAYARQPISWSAASGGSKAISGTEVFDVEGGDTVSSIGMWSALTVGTLYGGADVTNEAFTGQGTYTVTSFTVSGT